MHSLRQDAPFIFLLSNGALQLSQLQPPPPSLYTVLEPYHRLASISQIDHIQPSPLTTDTDVSKVLENGRRKTSQKLQN